MVEPPGIAPGSGPLITSAFIAIVRANPDRPNIGALSRASKGSVRPQAPAAPRRLTMIWIRRSHRIAAIRLRPVSG